MGTVYTVKESDRVDVPNAGENLRGSTPECVVVTTPGSLFPTDRTGLVNTQRRDELPHLGRQGRLPPQLADVIRDRQAARYTTCLSVERPTKDIPQLMMGLEIVDIRRVPLDDTVEVAKQRSNSS